MRKLLLFAILIIGGFLFTSKVHAATFYVDFSCDADGNGTTSVCDGTQADNPFNGLDTFANNARSAGDIAWVKPGTASTTNVVSNTFTTDGTLNNPITVSRDYDNIWGGFATSTQTYTVTFGSTTMTGSATLTDIATSTWVYVYGDQWENAASPTVYNKDYAYEVADVNRDTRIVTLYLPYKGNQSGAGNYLRIMGVAPQIGTVTEAAQIFVMSGDDYWYFKGLDLRSTSGACIASNANSRGELFMDIIFQGNGSSDCAYGGATSGYIFNKIRVFNVSNSLPNPPGVNLKDSLIDCNFVANSTAFSIANAGNTTLTIIDTIGKNCAFDFGAGAGAPGTKGILRNVQRPSPNNSLSGSAVANWYFDDAFGNVGLNSQTSNHISAGTLSTTTISDISNLRSGGGLNNELVFPPSGTANTGLSTKMFPFSFIKLFEYPIYADTTSKTYSLFFNSTSTAHWTADPTASEFWIECEYYNHASNAERLLKKSTDTIDFNGSTAWDSLDVTCQPVQSGILYLRGWYGKPREAGADDTNVFFMDLTPSISP